LGLRLLMSEELRSLVHSEVACARETGVTPAAVAYLAGERIE
jgi:predicted transcriptional regulator